MTTFDLDTKTEAGVTVLRSQLLVIAASAINYFTVEEILQTLATAYRSYPEGTLLANRGRELAEELEVCGDYLIERYGI